MPDIFATLLYTLSLVFLTQSVRKEDCTQRTIGYNQSFTIAHYLVPLAMLGLVSIKLMWVLYVLIGGGALVVIWVAWKWGKGKLARTKRHGDEFEGEKEYYHRMLLKR
jgi:hypothetical protein